MTYTPGLTPPNLLTTNTNTTPRPDVLDQELNDANDALNKIYPRVSAVETSAAASASGVASLTTSVANNLGRVPNGVPSDGSVANNELKLYVEPGTLIFKFKAKDNLGAVTTGPVGGAGGSGTAGTVIAEDSVIFPGNYDLSSTIYTRGSFIDFPSAAAGIASPLIVSFVAPCDQIRLELIVPPLFVSNTPTNPAGPIQFLVAIPFTFDELRLTGPTLPAVQYWMQGDLTRSELINVTVGATYTMKLLIKVPTSTGTAPTYSMGLAAFGQTFPEQRLILRVTGAS